MHAITRLSRNHSQRRSPFATPLAVSLVALPLVGVLLHPSPAAAQEACGDTQCGLGMACATHVQECPPCLEGESSCGGCEPEASFYCEAAACESAADCASHMECVERPRLECVGEYPSCVEGESDEQCIARVFAWQAESCQTIAPLLCTPRWQLPCEADSDCGDEFRCDSGACSLIDELCSEDADCPVTWFCATINVGQCVPVPGGESDECIYNQPPVHRCIEPSFAVRQESAGVDDVASEQRGGAQASTPDASGMPPLASTPAPSATGQRAGCSVGAGHSDVSRSSLAGLLALALLRAGQVLRRPSAAAR
jgi:hypothetical protein